MRELRFTWPGQTHPALALPHFQVAAGEHVFVSGPSGSGKSTLLAAIGGIVVPQAGTVEVLGQPCTASLQRGGIASGWITSVSSSSSSTCCLIFHPRQRAAAVPVLDLPQAARRPARGDLKDVAQSLLAALDLAPALWTRPVTQLSIGQQQRVAAARSLIGRPEIIVADEPTSALDSDRQQAFLNLLQRECAQSGAALVFVSHDQRLAERFDRRIALEQLNQAARPEEAA
jgi:putative ABC transport system ATP-binding protein